VTLVYDAPTQKWVGERVFCGTTNIRLKFYCTGLNSNDFRLDVSFLDSCQIEISYGNTGPCLPLAAEFIAGMTGLCGCTGTTGAIKIVVTE